MATSVPVPSLGESITQAVLIRWTKNNGDSVSKDEIIAELETDKANAELNAPAGGVLTTKAKPGDTVKVGDVIATLDENGAVAKAPAKAESKTEVKAEAKPAGVASTTAKADTTPGLPSASQSSSAESDDGEQRPSVRRLVEENGLDINAISGTGPGGKVTKEDVLKYMETKPAQRSAPAAEARPAPREEPKPAAASQQPGSRSLPAADESVGGYDENGQKRVAMSKIRKRIAQTLVQAQSTAAILTTFNEVDMSQIMALRGKFKERFQEVHKIGLGFMSFFSKAATLALKEFPRVNAKIDGDDIIYHDYVHLGIAVSTERGLAVPVLRNADQMGFAKIESEIKRLATAVRDGKLGLQELSGGTFSITNGGVFGSLLSTPILNPPQSAILGMHAIQQRPMAIDGKVEIRPMMYLALSYDHRLVDGRESVSFLVRMKQYLEDPARLMLEI